MKKSVLWLSWMWVFALVSLACAPVAAPAPSPAPAPQVSPSIPAPLAPAGAPEDTAWAKVVEAAKKEGKLNIYSYTMTGDVGLAMVRAFKERYGITADIITGRGAEFLERVKTEKRIGQLVADLHDGSALHTMNMKREGLTISLADLPVFKEQGVWKANVFTIDPVDKNVAAFASVYYSPWVNTRLVKAGEEPQVWRDLLKPQWKGKMILTDPTTSGGPQLYFVPLMRAGAIDEAFVKELYQQDLRFSSSLVEEGSLLARGERSLSIRGSPAVYGRVVAEGAPIKAIDMKDGVVQITSPLIVVFTGGPHPNSARLFINWFFSPEGQTIYNRSASMTSIRSDVPDFAPEAARITPQKPIPQIPEDDEKSVELFRQGWPNKMWGRR